MNRAAESREFRSGQRSVRWALLLLVARMLF